MSDGPFDPFPESQPPEADHTDVVTTTRAPRNWMGYVAFGAAALGVSVVGILLGHLGVSAAKKGQTTNRPFAFAGMVVGYVGLAATIAVGGWIIQGPYAQETADAQVRADVTAIGAQLATYMADAEEVPDVVLTDGGYRVNDVDIDAQYSGSPTLTVSGTGYLNWCVSLAFDGGSVEGYSYVPSAGVVDGLVCTQTSTSAN